MYWQVDASNAVRKVTWLENVLITQVSLLTLTLQELTSLLNVLN